MLILKLSNIESGYGKRKILKGLEFEITRSEIVALLGWNGSGKSTCLKTIAGILAPSAGEIMFKGEHIKGLSPIEIRKKGIAYVMQNHRCFPNMTVKENLYIGGVLLTSQKMDERIEWVFQKFPYLKNDLNRKARTLSGGSQQVLSIAMSLMIPSELLLIDEPTHGLDQQTRNKFAEICLLLVSKGTSILIVEQNKEFISLFADRIYWLEDGKVTDYK